jgi:signal transduction histidine kinase
MHTSKVDNDELPDSALVTHLQASVEFDKASLARELHDELGGLMVAAVMDVAWAEEHFASTAARSRLSRVRDTLRSAIDLKRKIIEELRPSLLDNVGLFAALSWEFKQTCARNGLQCSAQYPPAEMHFAPDDAIALFRIAQEALLICNAQSSIKKAELRVSAEDGTIILRFANDDAASAPLAINRDTPVFASMLHRIQVLGGTVDMVRTPPNGTAMTISIPVSRHAPESPGS